MKFTTSAVFAFAAASGVAALAPNTRYGMPVTQPYSTRGNARLFSADGSRSEVGTRAPSPGVRMPDEGGRMRPVGNLGDVEGVRRTWENAEIELVQGGSLRTWSFMSPAVERVQVLMKTEGRPLNANVDLWQGPDNCPQQMAVYLEDGEIRPFSCVIESPRGSNTVAIRNTAQMEFPLEVSVEPDIRGGPTPVLADFHKSIVEKRGRTIQGGAIVTFPFAPEVQKVSVCMKTDGRPLNARIENLQGPNNNKQVVEVYVEDGYERPFMMIIDTPGVGNVVRIVNTATVEFPLEASVDPFLIDEEFDDVSFPTRSMQNDKRGPKRDDYFFSR